MELLKQIDGELQMSTTMSKSKSIQVYLVLYIVFFLAVTATKSVVIVMKLIKVCVLMIMM